MTTPAALLAELHRLGSTEGRAGMARFGINVEKACGVSVRELRRIAKDVGHDQALARALWQSGVHEARLLATLVAVAGETSRAELDCCAGDLDSWDLTDGFTGNLVRHTAYAWICVDKWSGDERTFVRRTAFSLLAQLAIGDKAAGDAVFKDRLALVHAAASDERDMVKKAVSWALRQIGKRNRALNVEAVAEAEGLIDEAGAAARWVGRDALCELTSDKVRRRLAAKR